MDCYYCKDHFIDAYDQEDHMLWVCPSKAADFDKLVKLLTTYQYSGKKTDNIKLWKHFNKIQKKKSNV